MHRTAQWHDFRQQGSYSTGNQQYNPANRSHGILESELNTLVHRFQHHTEQYLHHTEYQRQLEHIVIVHEQGRFHLLEERQVDIVDVRSEERAGQQSAEESGCRQYLHQREDRSHRSADVLGKQTVQGCSEKQEQSVTGVSQTQAEEHHKERCKERRQVQLVILGQHIELAYRLEPGKETFVVQLYRHVVARYGRGYLVVHVLRIEPFGDFSDSGCRRPALQQHQLLSCRSFRIQHYFGEFHVGVHLFQGCTQRRDFSLGKHFHFFLVIRQSLFRLVTKHLYALQ